MTKAMFITSAKDYVSSDLAIFLSSVVAWAAANFSELITAAPILIGFVFQLWLRYRKFIQAEKQREELHAETMRLLREGRIKPGEAKLPDEE